jgi:hypothetical protein
MKASLPFVVWLCLLACPSARFAAAASPPVPDTPELDGVYVRVDVRNSLEELVNVRSTPDATWVWERGKGIGFRLATPARTQRGWSLPPTGRTIAVEKKTLRMGELQRQEDPLFARLSKRLGEGLVLQHLGERGTQSGGTLTLVGGLVATWERSDPRGEPCTSMLMIADPSENRSRPVPLRAAQPAPGTLARRSFTLSALPRCVTSLAGETALVPRGNGGGLFVYARPDGTPVAAQFIGYMVSEMFVVEGLTPAELDLVGRTHADEVGRQAE